MNDGDYSDDYPSKEIAITALAEAMHELREFGDAVQKEATQLSKTIGVDNEEEPLNLVLGVGKADILRARVTTILYTIELMLARLDLIDIEIDPRQFQKAELISVAVYSRFDKATKMLREQAKNRHVRFRFEGHSHRQVYLYPVFDILPFLLLDNAVKYAPVNSEISVEFLEQSGYIYVTINSMGPDIAPDELPKLTDKWFRGNNAKNFSDKGSGFGLYFAKYICDINNIGFSISQEGNQFQYNAVSFRNFVVKLKIPTS